MNRTVKALIEGKEVKLMLTQEQQELIYGDGMDEVYAYHKTTREAFDNRYKGIPDTLKAMQQEWMIVEMYNEGVQCELSNGYQYKYYPYFTYDNQTTPVFNYVCRWCSNSSVPAPSLFLREEDCEEAVKKFMHIYKRSRTYEAS